MCKFFSDARTLLKFAFNGRALRPMAGYEAGGAIAFAVFFILIVAFGSLPTAQAQDLDELNVIAGEGTAKGATSQEAEREATQKIIADTTREQVIDLIGDKKYQKYHVLIEKKILAETSRFVPIVSTKSIEPLPDGSYKISIEMKFSSGSLKTLIGTLGLLAESEGPTSVLPFMTFIDRHANYQWWNGRKTEENRAAYENAVLVDELLGREFFKQGFMWQKTTGLLSELIPDTFRNESLRLEDQKFLGQYFMSPLVARGELKISDGKSSDVVEATMRITVYQTNNLREIGELVRTFEIDHAKSSQSIRARLSALLPEIGKDLAIQVLEVWQKGTIGANQLRITVRGLATPRNVIDFKAGLKKAVHEIKTLKERSYDIGSVAFDADYSGALAQVTESFAKLKVQGFDVKVSQATEKGVFLDAKPLAVAVAPSGAPGASGANTGAIAVPVANPVTAGVPVAIPAPTPGR